MSPRLLMPMIDILLVVVISLMVQKQGASDSAGREIKIRREPVVAEKAALRVLADGGYELQGRRFAVSDPELANTLRRLHGEGMLLQVLVPDGVAAPLVFRTMDLVEQAGFDKPSLRPAEKQPQ